MYSLSYGENERGETGRGSRGMGYGGPPDRHHGYVAYEM